MSTKSYIGKYVDGGSQNSFYKIKGSKHGFKSFPNKSLANFAHAVQSNLALTNLAPRVYSPICRIRVPNYYMGQNGKPEIHMVLSDWGYVTEIAKPYGCIDPNCEGFCLDGGCSNSIAIENLIEDMSEYGIEYIDAHPSNLGYIIRPSGKFLVAIDFGAESVGEADGYPEVCWDGAEGVDCYCEACRNNYQYA